MKKPAELKEKLLPSSEVYTVKLCLQCGSSFHESRRCYPIEEAYGRALELETEMYQWRALALAYSEWMEKHPKARESFEREYG